MLLLARNKYRYSCHSSTNRTIDQTSARLLAISVPGASNWLKAVPSLASHVLTDTHYQLAMRLRLGLPAFNITVALVNYPLLTIIGIIYHVLNVERMN